MRTTSERTAQTKPGLPESGRDIVHLHPDETMPDLPEVKDIPGQEHVRSFLPGEMADSTISSADEEANDLLDTDEDVLLDKATNVTKTEKELLQYSSESMSTTDDQQLNSAALNNEDEEGEGFDEV